MSESDLTSDSLKTLSIDDSKPTSGDELDLGPSESREWRRTINNVIKSVVAIHFCRPFYFDQDNNQIGEATGFIVDAEQGIILTNRHVIGCGPFIGYVVFDNHEECDVTPIYRDPVHDFGFLRFDTSKVKYLKLKALQLRPELAQVGTEIRVVGNDAGEKLSILSGFISRLDRNAPDLAYGYSDFNTEYIQAAANASGGSSGSPVIDIGGNVVGLESSGNTMASTDFFLPLSRPLRALRCIQKGLPISRGTIQTKWQKEPFESCRRYGLSETTEKLLREAFPKSVEMVIAQFVVPEGPCDKLIEVSDSLVSINGELITTLLRVDEILDESVGKEITIVTHRNGKDVENKVTVQDLHSITPSKFVDINGAIFQNVGYLIAQSFCSRVKGVYVCDGAPIIENTDSQILLEVDGKPTPDLDTFLQVMRELPNDLQYLAKITRVGLNGSIDTRYMRLFNNWTSRIKVYTRDNSTGLWEIEEIPEIPAPKPAKITCATFPSTNLTNPAFDKATHSFAEIRYYDTNSRMRIPNGDRKMGYVVNAEKGYIIVPSLSFLDDLVMFSVTFASSVTIPGKLEFVHPISGFHILSYDTKLIDIPIEPIKLNSVPIKSGDELTFLGYSYYGDLLHHKERISGIELASELRNTREIVHFESEVSKKGGILLDEDGSVRAFYEPSLGGLDVSHISDVPQKLQNGTMNKARYLPVQLDTIPIVLGRKLNVPEEWIAKLCETDKFLREFYTVNFVSNDLPALKQNDILLSVNGKFVSQSQQVLRLFEEENLEFEVCRDDKVIKVSVPTISVVESEIQQTLYWCGATIQSPPSSIKSEYAKLPSNIYILSFTTGCIAAFYGLCENQFITQVNGKPVNTIADFQAAVLEIPDETWVKLNCMSSSFIASATSIKTNYRYFKTNCVSRDNETRIWSLDM